MFTKHGRWACADVVEHEPLLRKHLAQCGKHVRQRLTWQGTEPLDQPVSIDRAHLIKNDVTGPLLESTPNAPGIRATATGQRRDDDGTEVCVQVIRRHDYARSCLVNLASESRVKTNEMNLAAVHSPAPVSLVELSRRRGIE